MMNNYMLFCSLFVASWICYQQPIIIPKIYEEKKAIATAYNLEASQTDSEFCIGAGNHDLCRIQRENPNKCIVATRMFDLHTKLFIEGFGECEVLDRTAKRYGNRLDILMPTKKEALEFGIKELSYHICP